MSHLDFLYLGGAEDGSVISEEMDLEWCLLMVEHIISGLVRLEAAKSFTAAITAQRALIKR